MGKGIAGSVFVPKPLPPPETSTLAPTNILGSILSRLIVGDCCLVFVGDICYSGLNNNALMGNDFDTISSYNNNTTSWE